MEVKDVYDTTIKIENQLKQMGGYVINSELKTICSQRRLITRVMTKLLW